MFLETLDLRINDVIIYSKNQFNFHDNFKIIYKNEKIKRPYPINYFEVCNYIKDPSPKNLIVYRLLTNVNDLNAYTTKYGYFIKINDEIELVYFDPVFAIKDLHHLKFNFDPELFRFRIQQIGLTSITRWEKEPNFAEIYSFDLTAVETQTQNDKIFVDAIFAFDETYNDEEYNNTDFSVKSKTNSVIDDTADNSGLNIVKEDSEISKRNLDNFSKPNTPSSNEFQILREEIISLLKQALTLPENHTTSNLTNKKEVDIKKDEIHHGNNLLDLFKTSRTLNLDKLQRENIILKLSKS